MFGDNQKAGGSRSRHATLVADGTEIVGEVNFSGDIDIEGLVRGNLVAGEAASEAQVRVQAGGEVLGDIVAPIIVINGKVEGNIYSSKRVELAGSAEVSGDVHYCIIEMVKGSQVNGSLLYSPQVRDEFGPGKTADTFSGGINAEPDKPAGSAIDEATT